MSEQLARIEDFGEWLRLSAPSWTVSAPEVEHTASGTAFLTFSLCRAGLAVALCESPEDALSKIGSNQLYALYIQRAYDLLVLENDRSQAVHSQN